MKTPNSLHLYGSNGSPCVQRVKITCRLKSIPLEYTNLSLGRGEQLQPTYLAINPNGLVPALVASYEDGTSITLTQSVSIMEFLEESYPDSKKLLPGVEKMKERSAVRDLVLMLCADLQPPTNMRVRKLVRELGADVEKYESTIYHRVFESFEMMLEKNRLMGKYCVGDELTLADVCLVAEAWGCDETIDVVKEAKFKRIAEIVVTCKEMEEFQLP